MSDKLEWQKNLIKTRENIIRVENNSIENLKRIIQTLQQENARMREALKKISENNYDNYGLYDDDLQEQIDRLQHIATEALQQKGEE